MEKEKYSFIKPLFFAGNNERYLTVRGNSMWPMLKDGQRVKIAKIKRPLKIGRCYLFVYKNLLYTHRLFRISDNKTCFIGDYSGKIEEIPVEAIIGELKYDQKRITNFILSLFNSIYFTIDNGIFKKMRLRNKFFSVISKLDKR